MCRVPGKSFVNRFHKIILSLVLLVVACGANLRAETGTQSAAPAKSAQAETPLVTSYAPALLYFGPIPANAPEEERNVTAVFASRWPKNFPSIPITNSILFTWAVALVIIVVVRLGTRNMKEVPSGTQNFVEALVGGLKDMCEGMLEPKVARWVFPLASAFFIFIATANLLGLFPGVGSI